MFIKVSYYPYCMGYDPDYYYYLNGRNLALGKLPFMVEHPGTTTQILVASVTKFMWLFDGFSDPINQTLNPELHLLATNIVLLTIIFFILIPLGLLIYSYTKDITLALMAQLTPFYSLTATFSLFQVKPESFLIFASLLLVVWCLLVTRLKVSKIPIKYPLIAGLIMGFGLATKVTFLPLILIPLIVLKRNTQRLTFLLASLIALVVFTSVIIPRYGYIKWWLVELYSHSGSYGSGPQQVIDLKRYTLGLIAIFITEPFSVFPLILASAILLYLRFTNSLDKVKHRRLMIALIVTQVVQLLAVAKMFSVHYMIPVLSLNGLLLVLIVMSLKETLINSRSKELCLRYFKIGIFVVIGFYSVFFISKFSSYTPKLVKPEYDGCAQGIFQYVEEYTGYRESDYQKSLKK